jgi:uncharacterized protein (DUF433 family)
MSSKHALPANDLMSSAALNPVEAAFVTGLSSRTIHRTIDRREITPLPGRRTGETARSLGFAELVYLALRRDVSETLSRKARTALYREQKQLVREAGDAWPAAEREVQIGLVRIPLRDALARVSDGLARLREAEQHVESDPDIRAGEPVVRGTRVPVHRLLDLVEQGAPWEEILEDHPSLTPESLDAALAYARTHPRRGRPRQAPWRTASGEGGSAGD